MTVTVGIPPDIERPLSSFNRERLNDEIVALIREGLVARASGDAADEAYDPVPLAVAGTVVMRVIDGGRIPPGVVLDDECLPTVVMSHRASDPLP